MICPNCGAEISEEDIFCDQCGMSLVKKKTKLPVVISALALIFVLISGVAIWILLDDYHSPEEAHEQYLDVMEELEKEGENADEESNAGEDADNSLSENTDISDAAEKEEDATGITEVEDQSQTEEEQYILPESNTRYLTEKDIEGLSLREINYAKNEIYARHGRKFKSQELQTYFNSKSWYEGKYDPTDFDKNYSSSVLNTYEKKNAEFLSEKEFAIDSKGYQLDAN